MATTMTSQRRKDWAKLLYTKEHLTQKEIADKVGYPLSPSPAGSKGSGGTISVCPSR